MKVSPLARRVAAVWLSRLGNPLPPVVSGNMEASPAPTVTVQFLLEYPDEGMTREQALHAVRRRLGPSANVQEEDVPSRSDGKITEVLLIDVTQALADKLDRDGYWQARSGDVLLEAQMP